MIQCKVVLVMGVGDVIGGVIVWWFVCEGYVVCVVWCNVEKLELLVQVICD